MSDLNILWLVAAACYCFFTVGKCQERRATKLKKCEPIADRAAYKECLEEDL